MNSIKRSRTGVAHILLVIIVFIILTIVVVSFSKRTVLFPDTGNIPVTPYISASGTKLYMNGELYQFTGVNAFNIGSFAGNAGCGGPEADLDGFFSQLRPNSAVRIWAFQGSMSTNIETKQTDWTGLDRVVAAASRNDIKLIMVLGDQAGTCDDNRWKDKRWYESGYKTAFNNSDGLTPLPYLDYVKLIVERYKDSTAVAMWEPMNEPSSADCDNAQGTACYARQICNDEESAANALRNFFDSVGAEIKNIDKNHLISSGVIGDGQCGAIFEDYKYVHESPGVDVASYHDYNRNDQPMPGDQWNGLQKRLDQMRSINKPLIVGEVGMLAKDNTGGCMNYDTRRDKLKAKMDAQFAAGVAGFLPWALTGGVSESCNYDIVDNDPTISLLHDYPVSMGKIPDREAPTAPTNLTVASPTEVTLTWDPSTDNIGVVRYDVFINNTYLSSTTDTKFTYTNFNPSGTDTYHVKGKDAAGNNSSESNKVKISIPAE